MTESLADRPAAMPATLSGAFAERDGRMTAWAMMWTLVLITLGGVAVDSSNAYGYRNRLQNVADSAALAAAANLNDPEAGRAAALTLSRMNMPRAQHGDVIRSEDVIYGTRDENGAFVPLAEGSDESPTSVLVVAGRDGVRGAAIPTWMLRLSPLAPDNWTVNAAAFATVVTAGDDGEHDPETGAGSCPSANIISTGQLHTAANNTYEPGVCLHGHEEMKTSGNDYMPLGVKVTAPTLEQIAFGGTKPGSASEAEILGEKETETPLLDAMADGLFAAYWNALTAVGTLKMYAEPGADADAPAQNYFGPPLPSSVYMPAPNAWGRMNYHDNLDIPPAYLRNFKFEDGNIKEHDVWQWAGDMNFKGNVSLSKTILVVDGDVNLPNGKDIVMKDVFIIASGAINNAGNAQLGYQLDEFCQIGEYTVTLLAGDQVKLGGSGNSGQGANDALAAGEEVEGPIKGSFGVLVAAAGGFNPGGALHQSGGLYVEADENKTLLPGNMHLRTCDSQLASFLEAFPLDDLVEPDAEEEEEQNVANVGTVVLEDAVVPPAAAE